jgi:DNA primase
MRATDVPSVSTPVGWEEVEAAAADARADLMLRTSQGRGLAPLQRLIFEAHRHTGVGG